MLLSVVIPARNEQFLNKTILDVAEKSGLDTEIIAVLDGYWPADPVEHPKVSYIHFGKAKGMRAAINAGVAIARGEYVMKLDAHCMISPGFDEVLANVCQENWVCVPTRLRLDPENWAVVEDGRPPINYLYVDLSNDEFNGKLWRERNKDRSLDAQRVVDLIACQGSCYFMPKAHYEAMGLLDIEHYGTFRKDPQEVLFKTWTNGGRCVRVKDAWYAHLHKGTRYGRGYHASRSDWQKGDEYVKRWWTDDAWDERQKIPLRQVFRKFADMPGWQNHPWMRGEPVEEAAPEEAPAEPDPQTLPNLYQVLTVDDKPFSRPRPERTESIFWNEGRWRTFIEPLLPEDATDQTFVEMGCDAGLFLKLASNRGFRRVIGVEKNQTPVRLGREWRDLVDGDWMLLKRKLGSKFHEDGSFDLDELPLADVTLLSTMHYYVDINNWLKYTDSLRAKTCHVLIVSRPHLDYRHWEATADLPAVLSYFDGWDVAGIVEPPPTEGDPAPRELYSVLLKNPLIWRVPVAEIDVRKRDRMFEAVAKLAARIAAGEDVEPLDTDFARLWAERKKGKWSDRTLGKFVRRKVNVMQGVARDGLMDPIVVDKDLRLCDGGHRLATVKALGCGSVIVRQTWSP